MINPEEIEIGLDDGHGDNGVTPGKRTPLFENGSVMYENSFNKVVVKYLDEELKRHKFKTFHVAPTDADTPLQTRTNLANARKVDLYVSVHANAASGKWGNAEGVETFVFPGGESKRIGSIIHKHLAGGTQQKDRGVKDGSHLWVIRKTNMPAVLVECAFMDSKREAELLLSDSFRRECAVEITKGICEAYGVKYIEKGKVSVAAPNPIVKPVVKPAPKPVKEEEEMLEKAIVINAFPDFPFAESLAARIKAPIYIRAALPTGKIAKELYVVGGNKEGLIADKIIELTGKDRFEVARKVEEFLK